MEELGALEQKKTTKNNKTNKKQKTIDYQAKPSFFVGECRSSLITPSKLMYMYNASHPISIV